MRLCPERVRLRGDCDGDDIVGDSDDVVVFVVFIAVVVVVVINDR